ncbi:MULTISPECIES: hypothetical protein [unclassified Variovorax]|jgi:hypothetical protein|uniref:hypothetical protein n=1 Tax=unclassified Variovorax TaxID=663243 RepID=UPI0013DF2B5B|nr:MULTISPECIES: hypothetical protein [unclassified Variovorax]
MTKTLAILLAASAILAGCVVAPYDRPPPRPHYGYGDRDRDRDGVPNRYDRSPNNPYRY